jgi:hydroxymethylpyrimidine pyrophosphatase-like HAD family hydrolase
MYLWWKGEVFQNFGITEEQKEKIGKIREKLEEIKDPKIKGFEPKEYLITLHCKTRVEEVEKIVAESDKEGELYCWWNEEAYDIGLKTVNKGTGLKKLTEKSGVKMGEVMTVGNGINDENMTDVVGIDVSTDRKHLQADFVVWGEEVGGELVVDRVLKLTENG